MEKHYRSIVKAFSWRITATVTTMAASFFITKELKFALSIGFIDFTAKLLLYYLHERTWIKIPLGKIKKQDIEYHI